MQRIRAVDMIPGMRLARPIVGPRGSIMLARGSMLTAGYAHRIRALDIATVYILDDGAWNAPADDLVANEVVRYLHQHMESLISLLRSGTLTPHSRAAFPAPGDRQAQALQKLEHDVLHMAELALSLDVVTGLSIVRAYEPHLYMHSARVGLLALLIGKYLYIDDGRLQDLVMGAFLHDIGHAFMDAAVQHRPQVGLSETDYARYQAHTTLGFHFLQHLNPDHLLANQIAWQHHERFDGKGWPRSLRGDAELRPAAVRTLTQGYNTDYMLDLAEIVAVADVFDKLVAGTPDVSPLAIADAVVSLRQLAHTILNPKVVRTVLTLLPVYPLGTDVIIRNGTYRGYAGIVMANDPHLPQRPTVRLWANARGQECTPPIDLALTENPAVSLRAHLPTPTTTEGTDSQQSPLPTYLPLIVGA